MPRYGNNIYKRKDGRFEGRYIKARIEGKAQYGYVYADNYNAVKVKLDAIKATLNAVPANNHIVGKYLAAWLETAKPDLKESTQMMYLSIINNHLIPALGKVKLQALMPEQITRMISGKSYLSAKTIHGIFGVLNTAMLSAMEQKLIAVNPCKPVKLPKLIQKPIEVFTPDQQELLESDCDIGILICLYTGLRIGEICALKWGDIDFYKGTLNVRRTVLRIKNAKAGAKTKVVTTSPKTRFSERSIPMPKFLTDKLCSMKKPPDDYVISVKGKRMEPRTYQYRFKKLLIRLELPLLPFHNLRHTFSTRALELGFDIKTLSEILGHHNANITLKTYAHSIMEHKRAQMNLLEKLQK